MEEDYYTTLRVLRNASEEEIHEAYRKLARKYHPDLNPDDPQAEKKFEEIQAAFEVLSDPQQRAAYDCTIQSFATARRSPENLGDSGNSAEDAEWVFAKVRERSRERLPTVVILVAMTVVTIVWLVVVTPVLAVQPYFARLAVYDQYTSLVSSEGLFCFCTLVYGIVMFVLAREHFHR